MPFGMYGDSARGGCVVARIGIGGRPGNIGRCLLGTIIAPGLTCTTRRPHLTAGDCQGTRGGLADRMQIRCQSPGVSHPFWGGGARGTQREVATNEIDFSTSPEEGVTNFDFGSRDHFPRTSREVTMLREVTTRFSKLQHSKICLFGLRLDQCSNG